MNNRGLAADDAIRLAERDLAAERTDEGLPSLNWPLPPEQEDLDRWKREADERAERRRRLAAEQREQAKPERKETRRMPTKFIQCPYCHGTLMRPVSLIDGIQIKEPCDRCVEGVAEVCDWEAAKRSIR